MLWVDYKQVLVLPSFLMHWGPIKRVFYLTAFNVLFLINVLPNGIFRYLWTSTENVKLLINYESRNGYLGLHPNLILSLHFILYSFLTSFFPFPSLSIYGTSTLPRVFCYFKPLFVSHIFIPHSWHGTFIIRVRAWEGSTEIYE